VLSLGSQVNCNLVCKELKILTVVSIRLNIISIKQKCTRSDDDLLKKNSNVTASTRINRTDEKKKAEQKQLLRTKRSVISGVPLVKYFRYPRSPGSIFIMPSIGSNFFGKARGVCGNLLEKQFPLFLHTLFFLLKCFLSFFIQVLQELIVNISLLTFRNAFHILKIDIYVYINCQPIFSQVRTIIFSNVHVYFGHRIFDENCMK